MTENKIVEEQVIMVLKTIYDPELPVNIYELGLIYFVTPSICKKTNTKDSYNVHVEMTVTSPNCPAIESLPEEIKEKVENLESINECGVVVTFDPPWDESFMTDEAKLELGML